MIHKILHILKQAFLLPEDSWIEGNYKDKFIILKTFVYSRSLIEFQTPNVWIGLECYYVKEDNRYFWDIDAAIINNEEKQMMEDLTQFEFLYWIDELKIEQYLKDNFEKELDKFLEDNIEILI